ncbi:hypothetical protein TNCV_2817961 [Trichonephila clavipes]|nr:hypothetical protein TNCV_2817961 [Trichonephila clavipes]
MEAERSAFIARKIQGIVQAFQYRAEKAKEKLVQPPTPSPCLTVHNEKKFSCIIPLKPTSESTSAQLALSEILLN